MPSEPGLLPWTPLIARRRQRDRRENCMVSAASDACSCVVVAERNRALPARVVDLSPDGIRLALKGWVEPGTILGIEWQGRAGRTPCFLLAVIQGIAAQSGGG